jgi:hypothetical protein
MSQYSKQLGTKEDQHCGCENKIPTERPNAGRSTRAIASPSPSASNKSVRDDDTRRMTQPRSTFLAAQFPRKKPGWAAE